MFYTWNFTLPCGKSAASKTKHVLDLEKGTVVRCEVMFPSGCCGLVYVHINRILHQVYPKNPDYQYRGNGETIIASDEFELKEEPYQLEFYGWNTDDTYDHTITVRIQLVPAKEILHRVVGGLSRVSRLVKP